MAGGSSSAASSPPRAMRPSALTSRRACAPPPARNAKAGCASSFPGRDDAPPVRAAGPAGCFGAREAGCGAVAPSRRRPSLAERSGARGVRRARRADEPLGWDGVVSLLRSEPDRRALLLDPGEGAVRLGDAARGLSRVLIAVGPEGGFSPEERRRAQENGFLSVAMGPLVLRTETAGLAALAVVLHVNGELG